MIVLNPRTTALVLIDLQKGIVDAPFEPRSGHEVVAGAKQLAERFRTAGSPVVLVNVGWSSDFADAPRQAVDNPIPGPHGGFPADWSELVDGLAEPGDLRVTKRQWGAFHGTDLDLQLRRRGITTVVLGGIATNFGVESTARPAWELGYELVIVEDLMASFAADLHRFAIDEILSRIGRVAQASAIGFGAA